MKNLEDVIKSIEAGTAKLQLINDKEILNPSVSIVDENEYKKVYVFEDDNAFKAVYLKGEEYYYGETIYCADEAQAGSCNIEYEKLYKIL